MLDVLTDGDNWSCIPKENTGNRYAIFFSITDNYSFLVANLVMSLKRHSPDLMELCDILIYSTGISSHNTQLLKQLHPNTLFLEMTFPHLWEEILEHPRTKQWGSFVICKFYGFQLINRYEKVLGLDADMHIQGDISPLFEIKEDIAWRPVVAWKPNAVFAEILDKANQKISAGNGGMILFNHSLKKYGIDIRGVRNAFDEIKNLRPGGIDELTLAWITYQNGISVKELNFSDYNTSVQAHKQESKLIHFLDYKSIQTKPWKNPVSLLYYEDWKSNYDEWIKLGGQGLVNFEKEDYFKFFQFDEIKELEKLRKENKIHSELHTYKKENEKLKMELIKLKNSTSWKITKPFRWCARKLRSLMKKVKSCFKK